MTHAYVNCRINSASDLSLCGRIEDVTISLFEHSAPKITTVLSI